jgi:hypothetical protein
MPFLNALPEKMSEKLGAFAAGAAAEIVARDQDRRPGIGGIVEDVARLRAYRLERAAAQPRTLDRLQPVRGDDDVGIDVLGSPRIGRARNLADRLHRRQRVGRVAGKVGLAIAA